jgi:hypothetical protein
VGRGRCPRDSPPAVILAALLALLCAACADTTGAPLKGRGQPPASLLAGPAPGGPMLGVTCAGDQECWAVGGSAPGTLHSHALVERYSGTGWALASSPDAAAGRGSVLFGVSCAGVSECWAVGANRDAPGGGQQPLIEAYGASGWSVVTNRVPANAALYGVACAAHDDCWAVGATGPSSATTGLVLHDDGTGWSTVTSPASAGPSSLDAVACAAVDNCWAVGSVSAQHTLVEHFDGISWSVVTSPQTGPGAATLSGVTCLAASDCWAVGGATAGAISVPLIEHDTGNGWIIVHAAVPLFSTGSSLQAVACISESNCWAVGVSRSAGGGAQGLSEQFTGKAWAVIRGPAATQNRVASFSGVTCPDSDDCWVVGSCGAGGSSGCGGSASLIALYDMVLPDGH